MKIASKKTRHETKGGKSALLRNISTRKKIDEMNNSMVFFVFLWEKHKIDFSINSIFHLLSTIGQKCDRNNSENKYLI